MYGSWFDEHAYMEHGILVVPAAAYMAWAKKEKLQTIPRKPSAWGVFLMLWGALQACWGYCCAMGLGRPDGVPGLARWVHRRGVRLANGARS